MKAKILFYQKLKLQQDRYLIELSVYEVKKSEKFPKGIKVKFLLLDLEKNGPRLLIDNHEPYGFHMHSELADNHQVRVPLQVKDYQEAREIFFDEVERIIYED